MNADEWRLYDALMVRFSKILYVMRFPETLAEAPTTDSETIRAERVRVYFHDNAEAYHGLRTLVHAAVDEITKQGKQVRG